MTIKHDSFSDPAFVPGCVEAKDDQHDKAPRVQDIVTALPGVFHSTTHAQILLQEPGAQPPRQEHLQDFAGVFVEGENLAPDTLSIPALASPAAPAEEGCPAWRGNSFHGALYALA